MVDRYLLPTLYSKFPYWRRGAPTYEADGVTPKEEDPDTKYGGHEGEFLTIKARAIYPGVIRLSWSSPPTHYFTQFQLRRGSLTFPDAENEGELLKDSFVGGGVLDDHVPQLSNAYYAFFGLYDVTSSWILIGRAWCLSPKDTGATEALVGAFPRTFFTGGSVYDPIDKDSTMYRFLDGIAFMFDWMKSDALTIYDYPHNTANPALVHVLESLGDKPVNLSPVSNRRLISVMRHAQQRKGTLECIEEIGSALTDYACRVGRDIVTNEPILDNLVLALNDSSPYSWTGGGLYTTEHDSVAAVNGTAIRVTTESTVPNLAPPFGGTIHAKYAWLLTSGGGKSYFGSDTSDDALHTKNIHNLIPVNEGQRYTISTHVKQLDAVGASLIARFYYRSGALVPIFPVFDPVVPPITSPAGEDENPNQPGIGVYGGDTAYTDVVLSMQSVTPKFADALPQNAGWSRIYGSTIAPEGAVFMSWHILFDATVGKRLVLFGTQVNRGGLTDYKDPRTVSITMAPKRVNLSPTGYAGETYGWYSDSTKVVETTGHYSDSSLKFTPPAAGSVTIEYPREVGDYLITPQAGWMTVGVSIKASAATTVTVAWVETSTVGAGNPYAEDYGYAFLAGGARAISSVEIEAGPTWQYVSLSGYFGEDVPELQQFVLISADTPNVALTVDNLIIEPSSVVGPFFDGDHPDGIWAGTRLRSASAFYPEVTARLSSLATYLEGYVGAQTPFRLSVFGDPDYIDPDVTADYSKVDDRWIIADDPRIETDAGSE